MKVESKATRRRFSARLWSATVAVVLSYIAAIVIFSWPLPLHLTNQVVLERGSDFYPHVWNLWWMRYSLLTLHQNPYFTTYINYPTGLPLTYHVLDPLDGLASIPLQSAFGLLTAFNLLRFAQLLFGALAAYALCRTLRLPRVPSWVGGALFVFCPLVGTSFDFGQLVEISVGWLPLYILCLIKALGNRALGIAPAGPLWLLGAGLSLAASALSTWYFFIALALFTGIYVIWEAVTLWLSGAFPGTEADGGPKLSNRRSASIFAVVLKAALVGGTAALLLSPLIVALVRESATGADYTVTPEATVIRNSADLLAFFLPLSVHYSNPTINPHGSNPALGWSVTALAVVGYAAGVRVFASKLGESKLLRGHLVFWLAVATAFALLALGPHLLVAGSDTGLPMPYALLNQLPFVGAARVPLRFTLLTSLALAVLSAFGVAALLRIVRSHSAQAMLLAAVAALVGVELFGIPRTLFAPTIHPFYATIAARSAESARNAVLELPYTTRSAPAMYDQSLHGRAIVGGYTARHFPYPWVGAAPGVAQLTGNNRLKISETDIVTPAASDTALRTLDYYGIRYVTVHPSDFDDPGEKERAGDAIEAIFASNGIGPLYSDPVLTAYEVPPQSQNGPLVGLGEGWYAREQADGRMWRWTNGAARLLVTNPLTETMPVRLNLAAYTFTAPRTLITLLDGRELLRQQINPHPSQMVSIEVDLTPGEHWIELRSPEPPETPPGDARRISLGFERVEVHRR